MKFAGVTPVFKTGEPTIVSKYRPISLLNFFSKIIERVVNKRTMQFLDKHNILSNDQYGLRAKHSTIHAIIQLINKIATDILCILCYD